MAVGHVHVEVDAVAPHHGVGHLRTHPPLAGAGDVAQRDEAGLCLSAARLRWRERQIALPGVHGVGLHRLVPERSLEVGRLGGVERAGRGEQVEQQQSAGVLPLFGRCGKGLSLGREGLGQPGPMGERAPELEHIVVAQRMARQVAADGHQQDRVDGGHHPRRPGLARVRNTEPFERLDAGPHGLCEVQFDNGLFGRRHLGRRAWPAAVARDEPHPLGLRRRLLRLVVGQLQLELPRRKIGLGAVDRAVPLTEGAQVRDAAAFERVAERQLELQHPRLRDESFGPREAGVLRPVVPQRLHRRMSRHLIERLRRSQHARLPRRRGRRIEGGKLEQDFGRRSRHHCVAKCRCGLGLIGTVAELFRPALIAVAELEFAVGVIGVGLRRLAETGLCDEQHDCEPLVACRLAGSPGDPGLAHHDGLLGLVCVDRLAHALGDVGAARHDNGDPRQPRRHRQHRPSETIHAQIHELSLSWCHH